VEAVSQPTVSVIIPAYSLDRLGDLLHAIESVKRQTVDPLEIIVAVDHNPELVALLRHMGKLGVLVALNDGIIGGAETRNIGIWAASGDIVAFLDDDAWAVPNWIEELLSAYSDPLVMAVGGHTISYFKEGRPFWFPEELDWMIGGTWKGHQQEAGEVRNLIGPNMSFRRDVCNTVGYMLPELGALPQKARAGDETEFYIRLKQKLPLAKVIYIPEAVVYHMVYGWKMTVGNLIRRAVSDGYWKGHIQASVSSISRDGLSSEKSYLKYLLFKSILGRVLRLWDIRAVSQLLAILGSVTCVGAGYIWSKIRS